MLVTLCIKSSSRRRQVQSPAVRRISCSAATCSSGRSDDDEENAGLDPHDGPDRRGASTARPTDAVRMLFPAEDKQAVCARRDALGERFAATDRLS